MLRLGQADAELSSARQAHDFHIMTSAQNTCFCVIVIVTLGADADTEIKCEDNGKWILDLLTDHFAAAGAREESGS
ncbi:hypothetical protein EYF80_045131 [Liparis tanakae]|uniref:Uncharacterized protein n=1 Tax=Liparis tanakae TaxID=230148 RepID=A0A4Z2FUX6_9TELE|nr:hypothetical protein EYF80_045131 [Liparis tanakae]